MKNEEKILKKLLLPETNSYKANLHCHSTISDGEWTPEQIKEEYSKRGYSIVAYTDHSMMIDQSHLTDEGFLALRGFEVGMAQAEKDKTTHTIRTCHICAIALDPDNLVRPCFSQKELDYWRYYNKPAVDWVIYDKEKPEFDFFYSPEVISKFMQECRELGFFVTYNHPSWSMETSEQFLNYHGMHAVEMCNYGCYVNGYEDYNPYIYDQILRGGERIFCIGADDNHNGGNIPERDSFGAFTVIRADSLDYKTVTDAMLRGDMYASQGPEIHSLYIEDGMVHVTCSPAKRIFVSTEQRYSSCVYGENGECITSASFKLPEDYGYVRVTVEDAEGKHANTRAYFEDEI